MNKEYSKVNSSLLTALYITGFIISGTATAMCLTTLGQSKASKTLLIGMTVIFECGKGISFFEYVSGRHQSKITKLWFTSWIVLTCFSLFASMAFSINETAKTKNDTFAKSSYYKTKLNEQNRLKGLISSKQKQVDEIIKEKEATIKSMNDELNLIPTTYINKRQEALSNITNYSKEQQVNIDKYTKELEKLNSKLDLAADKTTNIDYKANSTTGYISILTALAGFLNKSRIYISNKWTFEELEIVFYFLLSLTLEIIICLLYYLKKYNELNAITEKFVPTEEKIQIIQENEIDETQRLNKNTKTLKLPNRKFRLISQATNDKTQQSNENTDLEIDKNANSIGFKMEKSEPVTLGNFKVADSGPDEFTDDELKEYLTYIYDNKNGSISPGQTKITDNTNLSRRQVKALRYYLADKGILKIDEKATYLMVADLDEVLNKIRLEA